ncbi:MAG TPA: D-alanine--D-alanine ligase [Opitutales bacterium]|jgi:D-alanine-D-alanine ligase|nr:D-alanine--D-alanine ligase [Opitutales bacterium]
MKNESQPTTVAVLCGSDSAERSVSLVTGRAIADALQQEGIDVEFFDLPGSALPESLDPARHVVFPALHGGWGENGGVQAALEAQGFAYAGCGPEASRLCMDKVDTKRVLAEADLPVLPHIIFTGENPSTPAALVAKLGSAIIIKPVAEGSSVGLRRAANRPDLTEALQGLSPGRWMAEPWVRGRELSVGVLAGRALGVVEIRPKDGASYDFEHKYTAGMTEYFFPAPLEAGVTEQIQSVAAGAFAACGCRDFARVDFMLPPTGGGMILEINTMPGCTPTSLLPKSASCYGYTFPKLIRAMITPALERFAAAAITQ